MNMHQLGKIEIDLYELRHRITQSLSTLEEAKLGALTPHKVLKDVSNAYGIPPGVITCKNRGREIMAARQVAQYLMRVVLGMSYPAIARATGLKDHTTVLHSFKKIRAMRAKDSLFSARIRDLEQGLRGESQ